MKEWKRPNWRSVDEYPKAKELSLNQWYWQFLRRREDYQKAYWEYAQATYEKYLKLQESGFEPYQGARILTPQDEGFDAEIPGAFAMFHIAMCPNPNVGTPEAFFYTGTKAISMTYGNIGTGGAEELPITVGRNQVVVMFNIELPISQQLEAAKGMLKEWQQYMLYKSGGEELSPPIQVRRHIEKWPNYLRALDARVYGETLEEIGLVLSATNSSEEAIEEKMFELGSEKLKRIGQEILSRAENVQFNFPF